MNVQTITMDPNEAHRRMRLYRDNRRADCDEEYRAIEDAYRELAKGTSIINAHQAISAGGFHEYGMPRLAIARADRKEVRGQWIWNTARMEFYCGAFNRHRNAPETLIREVDLGDAGREARKIPQHWTTGYAMVPIVPPEARPKTGQLRDFYILWEVDRWHKTPKTSPPSDPLLLRHLGGELYAVLAQWDLTEIEKMILGEIRN